MLECRQLTKQYRKGRGDVVTALDAVDVALGPEEILVVQGPSGSGKSTLLLIAGGLLRPTSGEITWEGLDIYALTTETRCRWRAENVGFVFQQFHLLPYLTALENVLAPTLGLPLANGSRRAEELLDRFGLAGRRSHLPGELSAGEQQRVALARALLHRPKILLCDEPTGNLDEQNGRQVLEYLCDFRGEGRSVLLVTHDAAAPARADRSIQLRAGRIAAAGSVSA